MNLIECFKIAVNAIWVNKMRSLLTMLGIIIGISSVIAVVALGNGSEAAFNKEFENFGLNRGYLTYDYEEEPNSKEQLKHADVDAIRKSFSDKLGAVSVNFTASANVTDLSKKSKRTGVQIVGVSEEYNRIEKINLLKGRFLKENDVLSNARVAVIDNEFAKSVFGREDAVGELLSLNTSNSTLTLKIVGIYELPKSQLTNAVGFTPPKIVYSPYTSIEQAFNNTDWVGGIEFTVNQKYDIEDVSKDIERFLKRKHNTDRNVYRVFTAQKQLEGVNNFLGVLTTIIGAIAAISLVVGGIGVMNIMLVSVTERTREIGIRKALGARRSDILKQFLVESVIISGIGGVIGTVLGIGFSYAIAAFIKIPPSTSVVTIIIAWVFSAGVGIFFGIYPANKAAKLDPIEALRYE